MIDDCVEVVVVVFIIIEIVCWFFSLLCIAAVVVIFVIVDVYHINDYHTHPPIPPTHRCLIFFFARCGAACWAARATLSPFLAATPTATTTTAWCVRDLLPAPLTWLLCFVVIYSYIAAGRTSTATLCCPCTCCTRATATWRSAASRASTPAATTTSSTASPDCFFCNRLGRPCTARAA